VDAPSKAAADDNIMLIDLATEHGATMFLCRGPI
jgi:hypothetical protein